MSATLIRLVSRSERVGDCLLWLGPRNAGGYGRYSSPGMRGTFYVHRVAWETLRGPIPDGMQLDHLCRQRACWNPDHLEPVSPRENVLRGVGITAMNAKKTHCPQGHPYDDANTGITSTGKRRCRACGREAFHRHKEAS